MAFEPIKPVYLIFLCLPYLPYTRNDIIDMIDPLHNRQDDNVPKAEPCSLLCSNNDVMHGSAFGFEGQEPQTQILLEQLAELIVEAFFDEQNNIK
jgi:hypothetical protein